MTVHQLPDAVLWPKDARNPKSHLYKVLAPANLGPIALYFQNIRKVRSNVFRYALEANRLAISVL